MTECSFPLVRVVFADSCPVDMPSVTRNVWNLLTEREELSRLEIALYRNPIVGFANKLKSHPPKNDNLRATRQRTHWDGTNTGRNAPFKLSKPPVAPLAQAHFPYHVLAQLVLIDPALWFLPQSSNRRYRT